MGLLHHSNYFVFFEMGRTELLREREISYRDIEDSGHLLVIIDIGCKFKRPAYYDDLLTLRTTVTRVTHVKIVHGYQVLRDGVHLRLIQEWMGHVDVKHTERYTRVGTERFQRISLLKRPGRKAA